MTLKGYWEVHAGVIPGEPVAKFSKRWEYTGEQFDADQATHNDPAAIAEFSKLRAQALDYYLQISLPYINNWATISFVWL